MNAIYTKDKRNNGKTFKLVSIDFCCDEAREAWEDRAIIFGEADSVWNLNHDVNFLQCSPYPEGAVFTEYKISFCPFCGKQVTTQESEAG